MNPALLDDGYFSEVLRGAAIPRLQGRDLFTTGYWYVRLCQAVLGGRTTSGVLSGPFVSLPEGLRTRAAAAVMQLPDAIGLVSLRELAPLMGSPAPRPFPERLGDGGSRRSQVPPCRRLSPHTVTPAAGRPGT